MSRVTRWSIRSLAVALLAVETTAALTGQRELMYVAFLALAAVVAVVFAITTGDGR
ncbi:hypothetical protein OG416_38970 [Streptomyces longwoodensis]|uniref:hypothetical protein n=1 Tax=Streptomyces longwoodensis TaxID=68231 RepID=UPI0030E0B3A6|nr:hypothetical protein OG416_38970 [Streptomyces longwoodensis]